MPNVIIHAKFHVDRLRGFWAAGPPKVSFSILIGTTLTTVLYYRADCDALTLLVFQVAYCHGFVNYATLMFTFEVHGSLKSLCKTRNAHFIVLQIAYLVK